MFGHPHKGENKNKINLKKLLTFGDTSGKIIFAVGDDRNTKETTLKNVKINLKKLLTNEKQSVIINNRCGQKVTQQQSSLKIED